MAETKEQADFVKWFRRKWPKHARALRCSMSAMTATMGSRRGAIVKNQMKAQGLVYGEPDIVILLPRGGYHGLAIEHKGEGMSRKLTQEQSEHLEYHASEGYKAASTRGLAQLKSVVQEYMDEPAQ